MAVSSGEVVEEVRGFRVTPGYFEMLGVVPAAGRSFSPDDARAGEPCRIVVSHRFFASRLEGEVAVGDPVRIGGREAVRKIVCLETQFKLEPVFADQSKLLRNDGIDGA